LVRIRVDGGQFVSPAVISTAVVTGSSTGADSALVATSEVVVKLGKHGSPVRIELTDDTANLSVNMAAITRHHPTDNSNALVVASVEVSNHLLKSCQMSVSGLKKKILLDSLKTIDLKSVSIQSNYTDKQVQKTPHK